MGGVLVMAEHAKGALSDITFELLAHARPLAQALGGRVAALVVGGNPDMAGQLGAADTVFTAAAPPDFNPALHLASLEAAVGAFQPQAVLVGSTAMGLDLAAALAGRHNLPLAAYCTALRAEAGSVHAIGQLYGGKLNVTSDLGRGPCVATIVPGFAPADLGRTSGEPAVQELPAPSDPGRVRFKRLIEPEAGDVDITAKDVLVAIGRGIGKKEDIEVAAELAEKLGAALAASRPIIDAGWLPKSRQVGKSGLKVKPKVYLALGISGAPEHLEGMRNAGTIIAVNTDKNAPIFGVAHYGVVGDLFDFCEELMEEL
jgi:electron transfer flavoprotein alpha subunit